MVNPVRQGHYLALALGLFVPSFLGLASISASQADSIVTEAYPPSSPSTARLLLPAERPSPPLSLTYQVIDAKPTLLQEALTFVVTPKNHDRPLQNLADTNQLIADVLRQKGLIEVFDNAKADLLVIYDAALDDPKTANTSTLGISFSLQILRLENANAQQTLFRAVSRIDSPPVTDPQFWLRPIIREMLAQYPKIPLGRKKTKISLERPQEDGA